MKHLIYNLKMEHDLPEMISLKKEFEANAFSEMIVCPATCYLPLMHSKYYSLGAQDVSDAISSHQTGAVSSPALKSLGVKAVLIGHPDCKISFEEKGKKALEVLKQDMKAILYISDTKEDYDYQYSALKLVGQIKGFLAKILPRFYSNLYFVYEPNWTSDLLPLSYVENLIYQMKENLKQELNLELPILYGGSFSDSSFWETKVLDGIVVEGTAQIISPYSTEK